MIADLELLFKLSFPESYHTKHVTCVSYSANHLPLFTKVFLLYKLEVEIYDPD